MTVISVDVPNIIAQKFLSYKIVKYKDLTMEERLINMDGEGWNDTVVDMEANDFLSVIKKEIINKR
ncbi:MAG: hypothetical protein Q9M94_04135 [Candidatus Gracilibacteria bacterium]|nr:hypothetical protein [Candidatus Gracilibacteria bacterium]MDQ7022328.1 hypothetical protein [Candidatus Gracilibacteria bacterium]